MDGHFFLKLSRMGVEDFHCLPCMKLTVIVTISLYLFKMSNPYDIGPRISSTRQRNQSFSPELHTAIYTSVVAGENKTAIACRFSIACKTVARTIKRFSERYLVQLARRFPSVPWQSLLQVDGNFVPEGTSRRILADITSPNVALRGVRN